MEILGNNATLTPKMEVRVAEYLAFDDPANGERDRARWREQFGEPIPQTAQDAIRLYPDLEKMIFDATDTVEVVKYRDSEPSLSKSIFTRRDSR